MFLGLFHGRTPVPIISPCPSPHNRRLLPAAMSGTRHFEPGGRRTHGEVTETKPELRIRARKAAALTVGEAMVAAARFGAGSDKRQERGTVRVCVHFFLGGGYPPHENA